MVQPAGDSRIKPTAQSEDDRERLLLIQKLRYRTTPVHRSFLRFTIKKKQA